ncbi:MAG: oligosaccharide flippase family protein [Tildeniella nuda ZEHNDER 1965/U140]|jgi:O-antigen/teichoic acid export membrane protein|nr:oligosaccharide flippase family protein [Tildeniella nuda ZEHNDER 1965/U140]
MLFQSLKPLLKSSFLLVIATLVSRLSGLIVLPIVARLLGPSSLGLFSLLQNTAQTADMLSRIGVDAAMHRNGAQYESLDRQSVGRLLGVGSCLIIIAGIFIALFICLNAQLVASLVLGDAKAAQWLNLTALTVVLTVAFTPSWICLIALHAFKAYTILTSLSSIVGALLTLLLTYRFGIAGALWGLAGTALIQFISGWCLTLPILRQKKISLRCDQFIAESKSLLGFGLPFYFGNFLSGFILLPLLGYVGKVGGLDQLGHLRVAQSLSQIVSFLPTAVAPVIISSLSATLVADLNTHQRIKSLSLRCLWLLMLFFSLMICLNLDGVIKLLFSSKYLEAIVLSKIMIWMVAINSLSGVFNQYMVSAGKTHAIAVIQVFGLIITVLIALLTVQHHGAMGLLLAQLVASIFTCSAYVRPSLSDLDQTEQRRILYLFLISLLAISLTFLPFSNITNFWVCLVLSLILGVFILSISAHWAFAENEREAFNSVIRKKIKGALK